MRAFLLGLGLALCGRWIAGHGGPDARAPRFWVGDRDAHLLVRLDAALGRSEELELAWPARVWPTLDGGAWVAGAPGRGRSGDPAALWRVLRLEAWGDVRDERGLPGLRDLVVDDRDRAWALWGDPPRLARLDEPGPPLELPAGARGIAPAGAWILIGFEDGEVLRLDPRGASPARWTCFPAPIVDLAPAGRGWWLLDGAGTLHRLDEDLAARWSGDLPLEDPRLARGTRGESVWAFDRAGGVAARVDSRGRGWRAEPLPLPGVECARALPDGGLLAAGGGGVVLLDARGRLAVGQGGFAFVAGL